MMGYEMFPEQNLWKEFFRYPFLLLFKVGRQGSFQPNPFGLKPYPQCLNVGFSARSFFIVLSNYSTHNISGLRGACNLFFACRDLNLNILSASQLFRLNLTGNRMLKHR